MRVGLIGTGAIAHKHAQAYRNIGFQLVACVNRNPEKGMQFAEQWNCRFFSTLNEMIGAETLDYVDVCTFPDSHLDIVRACAAANLPILLQKPIAATVADAVQIVETAGITVGVVSQKRFDDGIMFVKQALEQGRLGRILQADAYVKWHRDDAYYARPGKGTWAVEGGGALINQAIHQADLLLYLIGPVERVGAMWQLGAAHRIESEDVVNAMLQYRNGATGVLQASTALWPGAAERIEIHGTNGTAVIAGDQVVTWALRDDGGPTPPPSSVAKSGASDPMAINLAPFERQFLEFRDALLEKREPLTSGRAGLRALELVDGIYQSCRTRQFVQLQVR